MVDEQTPSQSLADRALTRLRRLAAGNGLEPAAVAVLDVQEKELTLGGVMEVTPFCVTESNSYPGGVKGADRKRVGTFAELQGAAAAHQKKFRESRDWIEETVREIKSHDSVGFGLENAKVTLPEQSSIYAATEMCPRCAGRKLVTCTQCNGQGEVICTQCRGQGRETCFYCAGRGENPQQPGQRCPTCNGARLMPCRYCHARGMLACPTCNGQRGTPCPACKGIGNSTQEIAVQCGTETHFKLIATGLPSGLRRGIDRIGIINLGKGHADIATSPPTEEELDAKKPGQPIPILNYQVTIPYAEMRIGFGTKKAVIAVVGKRCAISGVPNFLDDSLQPWRDKLHQAALGKASLHDSIEARAIQEIVSLCIAGKGRVEEIRRLYPFGLSVDVMNAILADTRLAINRTTLKTRGIIAVLCVVFCAVLFYFAFMRGIETELTLLWTPKKELALDGSFLIAAMAASWCVLNFSTRFVLQQRFPQMKLALQQKIGKTGYSMLTGIGLAFALFIWMAPSKPLWLAVGLH